MSDERAARAARGARTAQGAPDAEAGALVRYLNMQRSHVLGTLDGLDDDALQKSVLPSGWSCAGMVQHLAFDVERQWIRGVFAGESDAMEATNSLVDGWEPAPGSTGAEVLDRYRSETELADAALAGAAAGDPLAWWPAHLFGETPFLHTLRDILLHVVTETATHAGHLDAARELIDGRQWKVLT